MHYGEFVEKLLSPALCSTFIFGREEHRALLYSMLPASAIKKLKQKQGALDPHEQQLDVLNSVYAGGEGDDARMVELFIHACGPSLATGSIQS